MKLFYFGINNFAAIIQIIFSKEGRSRENKCGGVLAKYKYKSSIFYNKIRFVGN